MLNVVKILALVCFKGFRASQGGILKKFAVITNFQ